MTTKTIIYEAKRNTTGLTDVKITIWDDTGAKKVDATTMTELASGIYYYNYTIPDSTKNYIHHIDSATQTKPVVGTWEGTTTHDISSSVASGLKLSEFVALK